jgi:protein-S-isoprenylcysteine O-methyltransferase Ste14
LFALSLIFFLYCYLVRFGQPAGDARILRPVMLDVLLFTMFALHHSALARTSVKARVHRLVPPELERSLYTWTASVLFILVCGLWQPVRGQLYHATGAVALIGFVIQAVGMVLTVRSSARLDVLDLAGVRPVLRARDGAGPIHVPLETAGLYGFVRHPLYFGWVLIVFGAPHMTMTRLTFAVVSALYLALAIPFEERALVQAFGPEYRAYQTRVRWRMVPGVY